MKTIIIEDEKPSARRLNRMLSDLNVEVEVMLHSVEGAIAWFETNRHPELIFLDIQLSDGLSFEIFEAVHVKSAIIFTTAYDAYALKAFKLNSIDYLLKPIDKEELRFAVQKFKVTKAQQPQFDLKTITSLINKQEPESKKRFTVKVGQHLKLINTDDIDCFYSENKATYIHTIDNRSYALDTNLEAVLEEVSSNDFYKVNRKFIVNVKFIKDLIHYSNSRLKIILQAYNDDAIIVARERVKDFKRWLE
jgi:DNA-binding LytR/AlgR family response regulator